LVQMAFVPSPASKYRSAHPFYQHVRPTAPIAATPHT
jgi:hypothetical protein